MRLPHPLLALVLLATPASGVVVACAAARPADLVMREGIVLQQQGRALPAAERYRQALRLSPSVPGAYNNLALIALGRDELTRAVALLEEELQRHPASPQAALNRALVLVRLGDFARAEAEATKFAALAGGLPEQDPERLARQRRARVIVALARLGAERPAAEVATPLEAALSGAEAPDDPVLAAARRALFLVHAGQGAPEAALATGAALDAPDDQLLRAALLARLGRYDQMLSLVDAVKPADDADPYPSLLRTHALVALGRDAEAAAALGRLRLDEASPWAGWRARLTATLASRAGDWTGALAALEAVSAPSADQWLDRAVALAHLGRVEEARVAVAGVLRDAPDHPRALALRASLE